MEERENQKEEQKSIGTQIGWEFLGVFKIILVALFLVIPFRYFIAQPFIVRGASMEPSFYDKQYLIIDELTYSLREPKRGEAIIFRYPQDPREFFIKRVVGLPGEKIKIENGRVKIFNKAFPEGFTLEEPYLDPPNRATFLGVEATLRENEFFVLGDNRDFSSDSRLWGPVLKKFVIGRAIFRAWPLNYAGLIPDFTQTP